LSTSDGHRDRVPHRARCCRQASVGVRQRTREGRMNRSAILLLVAACTNPGSPGTTERRPAYVIFHGHTSAITVPASASVNVPIAMDFITFGGGCVRKGETESTVTGLQADVRAYQYEYHPK